MYHIRIIVLFLIVFFYKFVLQMPLNFQKCSLLGSDFSDCLKSAVQDAIPKIENGVPQLNIPSFNPLKIPNLIVNSSNGPVNVIQDYKNVKVYNIHSFQVIGVDINPQETSANISIDGNFPELQIEAYYNFKGNILLLPITEKGESHLKLINVKTNMELQVELSGNKQYPVLTEVEISLEPRNMTLHLDNLFDGNGMMSKITNKMFKENWKKVWNDVRSGYEAAIASTIQEIVNKIFETPSVLNIFT